MKNFLKYSLILFLFGLILFFTYICSQQKQAYFDVHATMELAKSFIEVDAVNYEFHTWRNSGYIYYVLLLHLIFGFKWAVKALFFLSLLWIIVGTLAVARMCYLWLKPSSIYLGAFLVLTLPLTLHYAATGVQDIILFTSAALLLLLLLDPRAPTSERVKLFLYMLVTAHAVHVRVTFIAFAMLLLFVVDWKQKKASVFVGRQILVFFCLPIVLGIQLVGLVMMRGREYGWKSFVTLYKGLVEVGTSTGETAYTDTHLSTLVACAFAFGMLSFVLGLVGLFWALWRKEKWSLPLSTLFVWMFLHAVSMPYAQTRYYFPLIPVLVVGSLYFLQQVKPLTRNVTLFALLSCAVYSLCIELPYNLKPYQSEPFAEKVLTEIETEWQARPGQIYIRGQLFTTMTDEEHLIPGDPFYSVHSVGAASFNFAMKTRVDRWYPKQKIQWEEMVSWSKGLVSSNMLSKCQDGDIFMLSPAATVYRHYNVPPKGSYEQIVVLDPSHYGRHKSPTYQMPFMVERIRRQKITRTNEGWKAGELLLQGESPDTWSGWPYAGRLRQSGLGVWELVWVDKIQLYDRDCQKMLHD